jgi:hypothetical protein
MAGGAGPDEVLRVGQEVDDDPLRDGARRDNPAARQRDVEIRRGEEVRDSVESQKRSL